MDLNALLRRAVELGASDVHLKTGQPPVLRRDGVLERLEEWPPLGDAEVEVALQVVAAPAPARLAAFHETGELDIAYQDEGLPSRRWSATSTARGTST
jgi:twitching motility protein PilT